MDNEAPDEFLLFPEWKQALKEFLDERFPPGSTVTHEWLLKRFGMAAVPDAVMSLADHTEWRFRWLRNITCFRQALLEQHRIALDSVAGIGYRVVPPQEQTALAMMRMRRELRATMTRATGTVTHVQTDSLTADQQRERSDALAKLAMLRGMNGAALKAPAQE